MLLGPTNYVYNMMSSHCKDVKERTYIRVGRYATTPVHCCADINAYICICRRLCTGASVTVIVLPKTGTVGTHNIVYIVISNKLGRDSGR